MAESLKPGRLTRLAAWGLFVLSFAGLVTTLILHFSGCYIYPDPVSSGPAFTYGGIIALFAEFAFSILGLLILIYRPGNRIGWLALLYGLLSIWNNVNQAFANCAVNGTASPQPGESAFSLFQITSFFILLTLGLFLMIFPNGRFLTPRWRKLSLFLIGLLGLYTIYWLAAASLSSLGSFEIWVLPLFIFPLLGIISLFVRWRRSRGDEKQQIKWIAFFLMTAGLLFFAVEVIGTLFYPAIFAGWFYLFDVILFIAGFPVVFGLAIFKYRLYDLDIIIRRTLVYGFVTLSLVLVYFGSVVLLQGLFSGVSGQQSPLAIVISTLLIAALFNPLRQRIQKIIDRRFYRQKYDAQQVLEGFAQTARDETDTERLTAELLQVIQETIQPETISFWLKR